MDPDGWAFWDYGMPRLCGTIPGLRTVMRKIVFASMELEFLSIFNSDEKACKIREEKAKQLLEYLYSVVPEESHQALTPDYEVFCKRRVIGDRWVNSLDDERVQLSTQTLLEVREQCNVSAGVENSNERGERPAEITVFADGYEVGQWLHPLNVIGRNDRSLHDVWREIWAP